MKKIPFLFILSFILFSCQKEDIQTTKDDKNKSDQVSNKTHKSKHDFTGEELFKSIYFGFGEYAQNLQFLNEVRIQLENISEGELGKITLLCKAININDASFFTSFKDGIVSNDNYLVDVTYKLGSAKIEENMEILLPGYNEIKGMIEEDIIEGNFINVNGEMDEQLMLDNINSYLDELEIDNIDLLESNMISGKTEICGPLVCVFGLYFAVVAHNTIAVAANVAVAAAVYFQIALWGPGLDDYDSNGPIANNSNDFYNNMIIREIVSSK